MPNISLLPARFDVTALTTELAAHPDAWGQYRWRTEHPRSPHREVSDIWVRYNALENLGLHFNDEHEAVWYPICELLPAAKALALEVASVMGAKAIGGVLITKVPAFRQVYPHIDMGWHALYYEKIAVQIAGNDRQGFCFDDASLSAEPGQSYQFNNQAKHWVFNDSRQDRITFICCIRRSP